MNEVFNIDCMEYIKTLGDNSVTHTLTDIPYNMTVKKWGGLTSDINKGKANVLTFELQNFLKEIYRVTKENIVIFCGLEQFSEIFDFFAQYQQKKKGTPRAIVYEKSNPSPMNGQYLYLSAVELGVYFRKPKGTFNAHCKSNVFRFPSGGTKLHPTQKNIKLIKDIIQDISNEGDIIFDPCAGSGNHLVAAKELNRNFIGCEIDEEYYNVIIKRL